MSKLTRFEEGFMCAVASLMQGHGETTMCAELLESLGGTIEDIKKNCPEYDRGVLAPVFIEMEARRANEPRQ